MHIGRMVAKEDLKGYVSTTKATQVAKGFAGSGGYVYLTLVESGFHIPSKGKHTWTSIFGEEEIASPAPIKWQNVMGYRQLGNDKKFTGPIYFLSGLNHTDNKAFETCYRLFSGIPQPM